MDEGQYHLLAEVEDSHWWHETLRLAVLESLAKHGRVKHRLAKHRLAKHYSSGKPGLLDAGCGTGGLSAALSDRYRVIGLDASLLALRHCAERSLPRLSLGSVDRLPFADATFDAVVSIDVLSHRSIASDLHATRELFRVLAPGGLLVLQLSAFEWLRGEHDAAVHQERRYTRKEVAALLEEAGFSLLEARYRLAFLLPLMLLNKGWARLRSAADRVAEKPDLSLPPGWLNRLLGAGARLDWRFAGGLPMGSSVFCVARRVV